MSPRDLDSDYDAEPPRRRRSRPTNFTPLFAVVAMMVAAILGASFIFNKRKAIEEDRAEEQRLAGEFNGAPMPFEDRGRVDAEDLFLDLIAETGPNIEDNAPDQLDHNQLFQAEMRRAHRGLELHDEALAAKAAGDMETFERVGRRAFDTLDRAYKNIRDWELLIVDRYRSQDGQVRAIMKEITRWKKGRDRFIKLPGIVDGPGSADD